MVRGRRTGRKKKNIILAKYPKQTVVLEFMLLLMDVVKYLPRVPYP